MSTVYVFQLLSSTKYFIYGAKSLEIKDLSDTQGIISTPRCFSLRRNHFRADSVSAWPELILRNYQKTKKHIKSYHIILFYIISYRIILKNIIPRQLHAKNFVCLHGKYRYKNFTVYGKP
jgi:hypothetical protein